MTMRLGTLLPRAVLVALAWVLATAAFTLAADRQIIGPSSTTPTAPAQAPQLTVPAVTGQAFVFAKGLLEDAGFAWRVEGPVHGYAGNQVIAQSPVAGTRVVDTGAPTVVLRLVKGRYAQQGAPEDGSSYPGTAVKLVPTARVAPRRTRARQAPVRRTHSKPAAKRKPARKPRVRKHATKKHAAPAARPPAFHRPGAPKEPLDEVTLTARADRLAAWVATNPEATDKNIQRWLYQHGWIVTGAEFGWWHGAQALEKLIAVDRRIEQQWGIGLRSEAVARAALQRVERKSK
jgi:hypothetical protein